eukprot:gene1440-1781_t
MSSATVSLQVQMSSISGKHNPLDIARETNPMMHQQDSQTEAVAGAFEARVPGFAAFSEPNVPKPGTTQPPNPSPELLEPVPIAKVTHDGDVTANSIPDAPASGLPRN